MKLPILALLAVAACGCATTDVRDQSPTYGTGEKPRRVLVYAFATSPEDVKLDHSVTATMAWKSQGVTASAEQIAVGRDVANKLADRLVEKLIALNLPAERAVGPAPRDGVPTLVVEGQILSVDEGNRTERVVIGLGAGRSDVRTAVQVIEILPAGSRLLDTFEIDAKSDRTPGMAETMGAGAAAGHLGASAAISVGKAAADETFGADVDADALRTATQISKVLEQYFVGQGWLPPAAE